MQNREKIVQAFVEAVKEVSDLVIKADDLAQAYKAKFQALNPTLTGTALTQAQINAVNTWATALNNLRNDVVVTTVQNRSVDTHGTGALG